MLKVFDLLEREMAVLGEDKVGSKAGAFSSSVCVLCRLQASEGEEGAVVPLAAINKLKNG